MRDLRGQHFLEAYGLRAELQPVAIVNLSSPVFVLDRERFPEAILARERMAIRRFVEFDHVAFPPNTKRSGSHRETTDNDSVATMLPQPFVVRPFVHQLTLDGQKVIFPYLLNMNERPLSTTEREVLYT